MHLGERLRKEITDKIEINPNRCYKPKYELWRFIYF